MVVTLASFFRDVRRPLYSTTVFALVAVITASGVSQVLPHGGKAFSILESNNSGLRFRLDIHESDLRMFETPEGTAHIITIQIAVPSGEGADLTSIIPLERRVLTRSFDKAALSAPLATMSQPFMIRGHHVATITFHPVTGNEFISSVEATVAFRRPGIVSVSVSDPIFDPILSSSIANYDEAKQWTRASHRPAMRRASDPLQSAATWYKIFVSQTGMTKVTGAQLASAGLLLGMPSQQLRLFNYGGMALEPLNDSTRPVFNEIAMQVVDGGDGVFDASDYVIFYGESLDRFHYASLGSARFINHPYASQNVYWLAASGSFAGAALRMASVNATPSGSEDTVVTTCRRWVHAEQNNMLRAFKAGDITDHLTWFWSNQDSLTIAVQTPSVIAGSSAFMTFGGKTFDTTGPFDQRGYIDATVNGVAGLDKVCNDSLCTYRTTSVVNGLNTISLKLGGAVYVSPYFDYANVNYLSSLTPSNGRFEFVSTGVTALARLDVTDNFTATPLVFDISDPRQPIAVQGAIRSGGLVSVVAALTSSAITRINFVQPSALLTPSEIVEVEPKPLRDVRSQTDAIVITPSQFTNDLAEWVAYRNGQGHSITVTAIEDVMDVFGWGVYDPAAIRDYVKYVYDNAPQPSPSVLLVVGDATFDYRDYQGTGIQNAAPTFIHRYDESASDDNYVYFGSYGILDSDTSMGYLGDRGYDMMVARWPVTTSGEIADIIAKVKRYESTENLGSWRSKIALVADDEFGTYDFEGFHTTQTEDLERQFIPRDLNREKIYLWDYPFETGKRKPKVNDAIVKSMNDGALIVNYVGHGNPDVWAGEHVFTRTADIPRLRTSNNLPLIFAASCDIGFFDNPSRRAMAEDFLNRPDGAIAVVSATRIVYSSDNAVFNQEVFDVMFGNDSLSACAAMYAAKIRRQYNSGSPPDPRVNDRKYMFFGDPFLRLGIPEHAMQFSARPDSLSALSLVTVTGSVVDDANSIVAEDGTVEVTVFDSERSKLHYVAGNDTWVPYIMSGAAIYRGSATVNDGKFSVSFITPLDIGFGGQAARISLYGHLETTDALGVVDSLPVSNQVSSSTDSVGPSIAYVIVGQPGFASGGTIRNGDILSISLSDPSGINLVTGMGHAITLELDDDPQSAMVLTAQFAYDKDSHTSGMLTHVLEGLATGEHRFKITAWDNANNASIAEFAADVLGGGPLAIDELLNYPNPMQATTSFSFVLTQEAESLTLELFTLSGRKIQQFHIDGPLPPRRYDNVFHWDGRDQFARDRVATGVYLYKATATGRNSGESAESFGKVVVIN